MSFSLSLSGGGCRAAAHIGVLKALERHNIKPTAISGASAGALVAALYCTGISPLELEDICFELEKHGRKLIDWDISGLLFSALTSPFKNQYHPLSILKGKRLYSFLKLIFGNKMISSATLPLFIASTDLLSGNTFCSSQIPPKHKLQNTVWQSDISICDAVYSSCCLPTVFPPLKNNGKTLVDGGVSNNLPVDLLLAADITNIIAVDIGGIASDDEISSVLETAYRSISIMGERLKNCYVRGERLRISPNLPEDAGIFSFDKMRYCIELGELATEELIPLIKSF